MARSRRTHKAKRKENININKRNLDLKDPRHLEALYDAYYEVAFGHVFSHLRKLIGEDKLGPLAIRRLVDVGLAEYGDSMFRKSHDMLLKEMAEELADATVYGFAIALKEDGLSDAYLQSL